ncbi:MAG: hypothetical protein GX454_07695 [Brooklawnia sp.]|nr:hypothetical protein [Brooklawnia sp.]
MSTRQEEDPVPSLNGNATFRRTGKVRAVRLREPRSWTTETSSTLTVPAGGWWVTSPDGDERGVDAADFPNIYQRCEGDPADIYRRRGTVSARQASEPGTVDTREGPATYLPGDWIVTNDGKNFWPVPDARFRVEYEPVSGTPSD